ncbi:hypothetical protein [Catenulispora pinisilvae]|uniref:hypothetical protein n=1 Tax=Catenulispora pinisilvae TaxID=2705253 RepID=UPI001890F50B|nr:hypothetical protein [Catenulispora pinisilvae]
MKPPVENDLPVALLLGYTPPRRPGHPEPLVRLGVTGTRGQRIDGKLRHVSNEIRYPNTDARVLVNRPGWSDADPRAALAWLMFRVAVERHQPFSEALDACAGELDQESHEFHQAVLSVNGTEHEAIELREKGLTARAAVVSGWTVVACVPETDAEPVIELTDTVDFA